VKTYTDNHLKILFFFYPSPCNSPTSRIEYRLLLLPLIQDKRLKSIQFTWWKESHLRHNPPTQPLRGRGSGHLVFINRFACLFIKPQYPQTTNRTIKKASRGQRWSGGVDIAGGFPFFDGILAVSYSMLAPAAALTHGLYPYILLSYT